MKVFITSHCVDGYGWVDIGMDVRQQKIKCLNC